MFWPPNQVSERSLTGSAAGSTAADKANDTLEELIVAVLALNGHAVFVEKGAMETYGGVATVLPY